MESSSHGLVMEARMPRLTLDEVLETERPAWAGPNKGICSIIFDGIEFWVTSDTGSRRVALKREIPLSGWWHKDGCNCRVCRNARRG